MSDPHLSQARIGRTGDPDRTIGCGLLVTPRHVVTCAHVVASALGTTATAAAAPAGSIPVDLPLLARPFRTTGHVVCWLPVREDKDKAPEDIAVLELADELPPAAQPAPLLGLEPDDYTDLPVHCFGFPAGIEEGVRRPGICRGENALGWVQLDVERGLVEGGFSGTGAWDPNQGAAVGLVVAARIADQSAALIPARTLVAAWPELDGTWRPRNPYKGLAAFGADDRADFFGRAELIPRLADRIRDERLTTLIGPSGSGKSSLIGAGLIPALADRGGWRCLITRPGTDPFDALADRLIVREGLALDQRIKTRKNLSKLLAELPEGPVRVLREYLADSLGTDLLLVVDQFEELFTNVQPAVPDQARNFVAALQALSGSDLPVHLLIAMRADFMGQAMEGPAKPFVQPSRQFQVGPLEGEALRAAVEGPAQARGVRFAPGLVEAILAELADQPGRLPLLQFALTRLWEEQRARGIDATALERIGGVRRALSDYADRVIDDLTEAERSRARRILVQLVRPPQREDEAATRQVASFRRIPEQDRDLLPELARSRLIVTARGPGDEPVAEIAHEALIREWERLATWVTEDRDFRLWQEGLRNRMAEWEAHARHPGYLLAGPPLVEAEGRLAARPSDLSQDDSDYIRASRRRAKRRKRVVRISVATVILILAAFGAVAWWQWQRALDQEAEALAAAERATQARQEAEGLVEFMTFELRDRLEPIGRLDLLGGVFDRVNDYYERLGIQEDNPDVTRRRAVNLFNSGDLQASLGDLAAAGRLYAEGVQILERLAAADPSNTGWQRDLSVSLNKIGDIKSKQGDLTGALSAYQESKAIREHLAAADPSNAQWQYDLGIANERVGSIKQAQGKLDEALKAFQRKYELVQALTEQDPSNAGWQRDLSASLSRIGDIKSKQGDLTGSLSAYQESKAIAERLADADPSNAGWQRDLSVSLEKIGDIKAMQGDLAGSLSAYQESRTIRERLADADPSNAGWQHDLSVSLGRVGDIRSKQGDRAGALSVYQESKAIVERLAAADPSNADWQWDLMASLWRLSREGLAEPEAARGYLERALEILETLEATGRLHGEDRDWLDAVRQRLQALD
ncbi:tetratricopeptide repeat protein [Candidatus Thiosymbion oneisti]|uniref:tetratricopeptide repeat protein n=1 Tax=Candidatus Thiosymbion oneisti TaxID=589554 RepID=UPI000A5CE889|nr:trypsin-like peptidase domain-containing protein [Candidatus Thiosymbion oneisti]